jgi:hypothetical protein
MWARTRSSRTQTVRVWRVPVDGLALLRPWRQRHSTRPCTPGLPARRRATRAVWPRRQGAPAERRCMNVHCGGEARVAGRGADGDAEGAGLERSVGASRQCHFVAKNNHVRGVKLTPPTQKCRTPAQSRVHVADASRVQHERSRTENQYMRGLQDADEDPTVLSGRPDR